MIKNKFGFFLVFLVVILLASACNGSVPSATLSPGEQTAVVQTLTAMAPTEPSATPTPTVTLTPKPSPTPTKPQTSVGPDEFPEGVNPLTGLKVENPELLKRRPVLVKVANYPAEGLSLIHISEPTRLLSISFAVFCLKKKKNKLTTSETLQNIDHNQ